MIAPEFADPPTVFPYTARIPGVGEGRMLLEVYGDGDFMVCGVRELWGFINLPPKAWLETVRREMRNIEQMAKESGVIEMRVAGRSWARILPDYEPFDGVKNGLRKAL
jgi:hypothetical protein